MFSMFNRRLLPATRQIRVMSTRPATQVPTHAQGETQNLKQESTVLAQSTSTQHPPAVPLEGILAQMEPKVDKGEQTIRDKLSARFTPSELLVQDVSGGCGQFYAITIASELFKGLSTIKQHRLVNEALKIEIEGIHGLQLKTIAPK